MAPRIYTSPHPPIPIVDRSIFTHLFASKDGDKTISGFPASTPAYIDAVTGTTLTRAQTKKLALTLGYGLRNHPRINARRGDTILVFSPNSLAWPVALFGSVAAGLKCTLANSAYNARELAMQYSDSCAEIVFSSEDNISIVKEMFRDLGMSAEKAEERIIVLTDSLDWAEGPSVSIKPESAGLLRMQDLLQSGTLQEEEKFEGVLADETCYLCYSSGTTGKPKGVETTHKNLTSVLNIVKPYFPSLVHGNDKMLGILPFYHIYGAVKLIHFPFICGCPVIIMTRFDPEQFCANVQRYQITMALIVPPVLVLLARHPAVDRYDVSSLETLFSGAAPLGAALTRQVMNRLVTKRKGKGSVYIVQGYGLTETSPTTHLLEKSEGVRKMGSIGVLLPNLEARLVVDGEGDGTIDAADGQQGELWIRGPTIMKGYLNNPDATRDSITPDKWFKTGDIAIRDAEGYYYIVDRRKELIKYKGFQVAPAEMESVLLTHPDVADVAVIGVESAKEATELPRAYVVHAHPEFITTEGKKIAFAQGLQKWIQPKVARHKYLRGGISIIEGIPKSAAGKILRRDLRERAKQELGDRDPADDIPRSKL